MLLCHCAQVPREAVVAAYRKGHRTFHALQEATDACTGCRSCRPELEALIRELEAGESDTQALAPSAAQHDHRPHLGGLDR